MKRVVALLCALMLICGCVFAEEVPQTGPAPAANAEEAPAEEPAEPQTEAPTEAPADPTQAPTDAPADPTEAPSDPTEAPAEPTEAPTEAPADPTEAPTEAPTELPAEPTQAPTQAPADPTETPTDAPTQAPDPEAWVMSGGKKVADTFENIIALCVEKDEIYIVSDKELRAEDLEPEKYETLVFLPDPDVFDEKKFYVKTDYDEKKLVLTVKVEKLEETTPAPEPTATPEPTEAPEPTAAPQIKVTSEGYADGDWSNDTVNFVLMGIPSSDARSAYGVIINSDKLRVLTSNTYAADSEGQTTLQFVILDGLGDIVSSSDVYDIKLDFEPPTDIKVKLKKGKKNRYVVSAKDGMSGVAYYSNDGGASWSEPDANGKKTFKAKKTDIIPAGTIMVMDFAGNVASYDYDFEMPDANRGGGGGGGGGGGDGPTAVPHAPAATKSPENDYNALTVELPEGETGVLVIGGTELPFGIETELGCFETDEEERVMFTAALDKWADAPAGDGEEPVQADEYDTLVIAPVVNDGAVGDYTLWVDMNGLMPRLLYNSGIKYLVIDTPDGCAAFPTEGFIGGNAYMRLKADGISTKYFEYSIALACVEERAEGEAPETEINRQLTMEMTLSVDESDIEDMILTNDENQIIYYYNVCIGEYERMREIPFEQLFAEGSEINDEE